MKSYAEPNKFTPESDPWPISDYSKKFLKTNYFTIPWYGPIEYAPHVKGTDIECTTIEYIQLTALGTKKLGTL